MTAQTDTLIRALLDPSLSLTDVADRLGLTLTDLARLAESEGVQRTLDSLAALSHVRAAAIAAHSLPAAARAMSLTLAAYADAEKRIPADDPKAPTQRRLWADAARKATNLLARLARSIGDTPAEQHATPTPSAKLGNPASPPQPAPGAVPLHAIRPEQPATITSPSALRTDTAVARLTAAAGAPPPRPDIKPRPASLLAA